MCATDNAPPLSVVGRSRLVLVSDLNGSIAGRQFHCSGGTADGRRFCWATALGGRASRLYLDEPIFTYGWTAVEDRPKRSRYVFGCPKCEYFDGRHERSPCHCVLSRGVQDPSHAGNRPRDRAKGRNKRQDRWHRLVHSARPTRRSLRRTLRRLSPVERSSGPARLSPDAPSRTFMVESPYLFGRTDGRDQGCGFLLEQGPHPLFAGCGHRLPLTTLESTCGSRGRENHLHVLLLLPRIGQGEAARRSAAWSEASAHIGEEILVHRRRLGSGTPSPARSDPSAANARARQPSGTSSDHRRLV
jgi:hypothetical protein